MTHYGLPQAGVTPDPHVECRATLQHSRESTGKLINQAAKQIRELEAENERLRDDNRRLAEMWQSTLESDQIEIDWLRAALVEIMQGARSVDYAIHVARVALANDKQG